MTARRTTFFLPYFQRSPLCSFAGEGPKPILTGPSPQGVCVSCPLGGNCSFGEANSDAFCSPLSRSQEETDVGLGKMNHSKASKWEEALRGFAKLSGKTPLKDSTPLKRSGFAERSEEVLDSLLVFRGELFVCKSVRPHTYSTCSVRGGTNPF